MSVLHGCTKSMFITTQFQLAQCFDTVTSFTCTLSLGLLWHVFSPALSTLAIYRADKSTPAFSTPVLTVPLCPPPQIPSTRIQNEWWNGRDSCLSGDTTGATECRRLQLRRLRVSAEWCWWSASRLFSQCGVTRLRHRHTARCHLDQQCIRHDETLSSSSTVRYYCFGKHLYSTYLCASVNTLQ